MGVGGWLGGSLSAPCNKFTVATRTHSNQRSNRCGSAFPSCATSYSTLAGQMKAWFDKKAEEAKKAAAAVAEKAKAAATSAARRQRARDSRLVSLDYDVSSVRSAPQRGARRRDGRARRAQSLICRCSTPTPSPAVFRLL